MKIAIGADHAGYALKELVKPYITRLGHEVIDVGTFSTDSVDYPDIAAAVAREVTEGDAERAVLMCGSGVGASIAANKVPGIRAAICHDAYSAAQGVQHDDMNVLTIGARVVADELAKTLITAFLESTFQDDVERYVRRLDKVIAIENTYTAGEEGE